MYIATPRCKKTHRIWMAYLTGGKRSWWESAAHGLLSPSRLPAAHSVQFAALTGEYSPCTPSTSLFNIFRIHRAGHHTSVPLL